MKRHVYSIIALALALSGCAENPDLFTPRVATPTFNPEGGTYTAAQNVTISCATDEASIYCSLDGSDPTAANGTAYTGSAISISTTTTVKALATKDKMSDSAVGSAKYTISIPQVAAPVIFPPPGTYYIAFLCKSSITCATEGATIVYSIDGTEPSRTNGTVWGNPNGGSVTFHDYEMINLQAMAYLDGMIDSAVVSSGFQRSEKGDAQICL
jgi:chitinase